MLSCVSAGFIILLASGKAWMAFAAMAIVGLLVLRFKNYSKELIKKQGGVADAKVLGYTCHKEGQSVPNPRYTEYTVLVKYRNGNRVKYVLNGDQPLFKELSPYLTKG